MTQPMLQPVPHGESRCTHISSPANPLIRALRRLSQTSTAYRKQGQVWLEGDHLCSAARARGIQPELAVFCESFWPLAQSEWAHTAIKNIVIPDSLMREVSTLDSPASMGFVIDLPLGAPLQPHAPSIILDRLQDAGNVGSIMRSAAAFGFVQVIALTGTAALWSPKVLRAGMGAHFGLALHEGVDIDVLAALTVPVAVTSSHQGQLLHEARLPMPCAWVFGHEGQGASDALMARSSLQVRIAQPGGEESLNVAAAAAICLYASSLVRSPA